MTDLPDRVDCTYCVDTRRIDPRLAGCMKHYPNGSANHLRSRDEMDEAAAMAKMRALMPADWEREPWPAAFVTLILDAAWGVTDE